MHYHTLIKNKRHNYTILSEKFLSRFVISISLVYNLNKNSSEEEILFFSYEQFEKMSVSELNKKISKTKNECDRVNRQNICEHIFFLLKGCNYEKL